MDVDGDERSTGEVTHALCKSERVAASLEPVHSDDDGGEHVCDLGLGEHAPSLGIARPAAIRVDAPSACGSAAIPGSSARPRAASQRRVALETAATAAP